MAGEEKELTRDEVKRIVDSVDPFEQRRAGIDDIEDIVAKVEADGAEES